MSNHPNDDLFAHFLEEDVEPTPTVKQFWDDVLADDSDLLDIPGPIKAIEPRHWNQRCAAPWIHAVVADARSDAERAAETARGDILPENTKLGFTPNGLHFVCRLTPAEQFEEAPYGVVLLRAMIEDRTVGTRVLLLKPDATEVANISTWTGNVVVSDLATQWEIDADRLRRGDDVRLYVTGLTDADLETLTDGNVQQIRDWETKLDKDPRLAMLQLLLASLTGASQSGELVPQLRDLTETILPLADVNAVQEAHEQAKTAMTPLVAASIPADTLSEAAQLLDRPLDTPFSAWLREQITPMLRPPRADYRAIANEVLSHFVTSSWMKTISVLELFVSIGEITLGLEPELVGESRAAFRAASGVPVHPPRSGSASRSAAVPPEAAGQSAFQESTIMDRERLRETQRRFNDLRKDAIAQGYPQLYLIAVLSHVAGRNQDEIANLLNLPHAKVRLALLEASEDLKLKLTERGE